MPPRRSGRSPGPAGKPGGRRHTPAGPSRGERHARERRPTSRPAQQRKTAAGPQPPTAKRPARLTGRAAVLGLVVCALVLTLAYPLRAYLAQRTQMAQVSKQVQNDQRQVDKLEKKRKQLEDPGYIESQARSRLGYAKQGEKTLVVVSPTPTKPPDRSPQVRKDASDTDPWWVQLWSTVQGAGKSPRK